MDYKKLLHALLRDVLDCLLTLLDQFLESVDRDTNLSNVYFQIIINSHFRRSGRHDQRRLRAYWPSHDTQSCQHRRNFSPRRRRHGPELLARTWL